MEGSSIKVPRLLSVAEAAELIARKRYQLYDMIAKGRGPRVIRDGRAIWIPETALVEWLQRRRQEQ